MRHLDGVCLLLKGADSSIWEHVHLPLIGVHLQYHSFLHIFRFYFYNITVFWVLSDFYVWTNTTKKLMLSRYGPANMPTNTTVSNHEGS